MMQALEGAARARWDNVPISAGRMMSELSDAMLPDTVLFDESVTAGGYLMRYLRFDDTGRHYRAAGGGLGPGMPNPIGIKLARPDKPGPLGQRRRRGALHDPGALDGRAPQDPGHLGHRQQQRLPHPEAEHARVPRRRRRRPPIRRDGHDRP